MGVNVNEAGRDDKAARIDDRLCSIRNGWRDPEDAFPLDGQVGKKCRGTGSVDNTAVLDDQRRQSRALPEINGWIAVGGPTGAAK